MKNETLIILPETYEKAFSAEQLSAIKKRILYMGPALFGLTDYITPFVEVVSNPKGCKDDTEKIIDFTETADRAQWVIAVNDWRTGEFDRASLTSARHDICHIIHDALDSFRVIGNDYLLTCEENKIIEKYMNMRCRAVSTLPKPTCTVEEDLE